MTPFGPYPARVDSVHDGDSVYLTLDLGFGVLLASHGLDGKPRIECRISGIDAPELATAPGKESLAFAQQLLLPGDLVRVVSHGWDKWSGRFDGTVTLADGSDFAQNMIKAGHALPWDGNGPRPYNPDGSPR